MDCISKDGREMSYIYNGNSYTGKTVARLYEFPSTAIQLSHGEFVFDKLDQKCYVPTFLKNTCWWRKFENHWHDQKGVRISLSCLLVSNLPKLCICQFQIYFLVNVDKGLWKRFFVSVLWALNRRWLLWEHKDKYI